MLNQISIMGRLTRDPELRRTATGIPVASFSIACDRNFTEGVDFFDVVAWKGTGEFVSKYFSKGRMIVVAGHLQTREWNDNEGRRRKATEIIAENVYFGDSKKADQAPAPSEDPFVTYLKELDEDDSKLPF